MDRLTITKGMKQNLEEKPRRATHPCYDGHGALDFA